ncbi:hypothetical protein IG611_09760 [Pectobacterium sp. A535-S3-A17]|uniref:hypothetical protein n=1 Tax=Pectobacterium quasiaquaticum TaxID=2774015 RepID=UPI001874D4CF|nr:MULTISPECIES: hypothetical protein [Pectobacterium]MBE5212552.1 hypothetical protein [Pectobacterium quasiaquaticum]MBE5225642.1 hypothetical protein [Pectobacterium quasiaquaticum]MBN3066270.1 hypothetical protein [Pectobacterium aquaticum]
MDDYIYRIDTAVKLKKIQDGFFRAKRWENRNGIDYPHKLLKDHYAELAPAEGVYLMCFYSSQQKAEISLKNDFSYLGDCQISRCRKETVLDAGFIESWDDGFPVGEAYLFWCQEVLNQSNTKFSCMGISLEHIETMRQGEWISLIDYIKNNSPSVNTTLESFSSPKDTSGVQSKKTWWKFWS